MIHLLGFIGLPVEISEVVGTAMVAMVAMVAMAEVRTAGRGMAVQPGPTAEV